MFGPSRAEFDNVVANPVSADAFLEKVSLVVVPPHNLLTRAGKFPSGTEDQFYGVGHPIMARNLEMQLENALLLHDGDLLIERLDVAHLPVREVQLAPEAKVAGGSQWIIALGIPQVLGQGLIVRDIVALMQNILIPAGL